MHIFCLVMHIILCKNCIKKLLKIGLIIEYQHVPHLAWQLPIKTRLLAYEVNQEIRGDYG